jgi:hypothetical protein
MELYVAGMVFKPQLKSLTDNDLRIYEVRLNQKFKL